MSNAQLQLDSVGRVAATLQRSVGSILAAMERLSMSPAGLLNGVPHLDREQVDALRHHFAKTRTSNPVSSTRPADDISTR